MKLRQRRGIIGDNGSILPLTINGDTHRMGTLKRRRRRSIPTEVSMKDACCMGLSCTSIGIIVYLLLVSLNDSQSNNRIARVLPKQQTTIRKSYDSIKCANGSMGLIDDDYCDCTDGRDEPNTSACSNILVQQKSFHCRDGATIHASRVNDGVFDCPDKSDELGL